MSKVKVFVSLRVKLLIILAVALIVAAAVFVAVREFGNFLIWRYYLDEENKNERAEGYIEDFQDYVKDNKLLTTDSDKINGWSAGDFVELIFYKDSNLIYAPEWFEQMENEKNNPDEDPDADPDGGKVDESDTEAPADDGNNESGEVGDEAGGEETDAKKPDGEDSKENSWLSGDRGFKQYLSEEEREKYLELLEIILDGNQELRPVEFVDGTLLVTVVDYTEDFVYGVAFAIALLMALVVLLLIMIFNFTGMATRINRLAHKVKLVESGNLDLPIRADGNDEITALANDVNSMRNAVVDNMSKEKQAWEANTELITAMSHDVRTPLTVLLGYLDLIDIQNTDPSSEEYIDACKENALKLKRLSDDMFSYFLVFGRSDIMQETIEPQDSNSIDHMIMEHQLLLEEKGYEFDCESLPEVKVLVDTTFLGRVIDNVFSNISKYADSMARVTMRSSIEDGYLTISFENKIKKDDSHPESNHIGLKTCMKIMERMNGRFETASENGVFISTVKLPLLD